MPNVVSSAEYRTRLWPALRLLENDLARPFDVKECALLACMASFHFHAVFRKVIGVGPAQYLRQRRLSEAAKDLLSSSETLMNVAMRYGYGSSEAFSRAFYGFFHVWPSEYRDRGLDVFRLESELAYPEQLPLQTAAFYGGLRWVGEQVFYGMYLYGDNVHADNMRLLYSFLDVSRDCLTDQGWVIADRYIMRGSQYDFFVGRRANDFNKVPSDLQMLVISPRAELQVEFHGSVDDLHGDCRCQVLDAYAKSQGCQIRDEEWKLECPEGPSCWTRRGYRLNVPVRVSQ